MSADANARATLINADEAARLLNVPRITIYSYVNRGKLTRHRSPQGDRFFLLDRGEVERLRPRRRRPLA
jgi:excisionase family DNA binding protein